MEDIVGHAKTCDTQNHHGEVSYKPEEKTKMIRQSVLLVIALGHASAEPNTMVVKL
jgi:hypothetical protein